MIGKSQMNWYCNISPTESGSVSGIRIKMTPAPQNPGLKGCMHLAPKNSVHIKIACLHISANDAEVPIYFETKKLANFPQVVFGHLC